MAKKSKVVELLEKRIRLVTVERDGNNALITELENVLAQLQSGNAPKRAKMSAVRQATVEKFNEIAKGAAEGKT